MSDDDLIGEPEITREPEQPSRLDLKIMQNEALNRDAVEDTAGASDIIVLSLKVF